LRRLRPHNPGVGLRLMFRVPATASHPAGAATALTAATEAGRVHGRGGIDVSVVMPCLNEEASVGTCVRKALDGLAAAVSAARSSWSTTGPPTPRHPSPKPRAHASSHEKRRGYGNAYRAGFAAARGRHILMGDSDDHIRLLAAPRARGAAARRSGRLRPRLQVRRRDPARRHALAAPVRGQPRPHCDSQPPLRRPVVGCAFRDEGVHPRGVFCA
jgi:hypothetical protein